MTITSINFFVFLILTTSVYYLCPKKVRWVSLLAFTAAFFLLNSAKVFYYTLFGTAVAYWGGRLMEETCKTERQKRTVLILSISLIVATLFLLKYVNVIPNSLNAFGRLFHLNLQVREINLLAPIGISYYSLTLWAYLVDVYRTTAQAERNYCKLLLFACYYPCLVSGPILRYPEMREQLFVPRSLQWENVFRGFHRIVYGLLKKMFLADTLAVNVRLIFFNPDKYSGPLLLFGVAMYAMQIYCDFSGCMDIVLGASQLYGVKLPENFNSPFFSRTLSEFWRRWHITLGLWGKDYILYPLLKSARFQRLGSWAKKRFGKKLGKKLPLILAIWVLWAIIGFWHGATWKYFFAAGMLPWVYFSLSELCSDLLKKATEKLHLKTDTFSFHLLQSGRTLLLMLIIWLITLAPTLSQGSGILARLFDFPSSAAFSQVARAVTYCSLTRRSAFLKLLCLMASLLGVTVVDTLNYKGVPVAERFDHQSLWFRYLILFAMIGTIICFGAYGPGFHPGEFIYGGF